jgi:hypothetical protein
MLLIAFLMFFAYGYPGRKARPARGDKERTYSQHQRL